MEQELAGNAFATSGTAYPSVQGTPLRQDWKQKMGTEEGAKELRATAEAKLDHAPSAKRSTSTKGNCPGGPFSGQVTGYRNAGPSKP